MFLVSSYLGGRHRVFDLGVRDVVSVLLTSFACMNTVEVIFESKES